MNIYEFSDIIGKKIIITYFPNQNGRFMAQFEDCETKDGICLKSEYGNGNTPDKAVIEYCELIKGKLIVFNAMDEKRRKEFNAPKELSL